LSFKPSKKSEVVAKDVAGEMVLLIPSSGKYFGLNAVGASFWELMDGERSLDDIAAVLAEQYNVEISVVRADLLELAEQLAASQLIDMK
jgi:hypothetical protein